MGNALPIVSPPKPSPSRAVIFLEPQCIREYFREPWRRPPGEIQMLGSADALPPALHGVVCPQVYRDMVESIIERAARYNGGRIHIGIAMFQVYVLLAIILLFFLSRFGDFNLMNPAALATLCCIEFGILIVSGRLLNKEERGLKADLLALLHPWRAEYGITSKMIRTAGQIKINASESAGEDRTTSNCYCLVLVLDDDTNTVCTSPESEDGDIESQA